MLKIPIAKTTAIFIALCALSLTPLAAIAIEDCGTSVTECELRQDIKDLKGQVTALESSLQALRLQLALSNGLVAYYPFDGDANDESGHGNHGSEHGSLSYVPGLIGLAASFDVDNYILVEHNHTLSFSLGKEYTTSIWVNLTHSIPEGTNQKVFFKGVRGVGANYTLEFLKSKFGGIERIYLNSDTAIKYNHPIGSWYHIVSLYNSKNDRFEFYVNGTKITLTWSDTEHYHTSSTPLTIGGRLGSSSPFSGKVDEFRIYNRALSAEEIKQLYTLPSN